MKTTLILFSVLISFYIFGQNENKPFQEQNGLVFCPGGSYLSSIINETDTIKRTINVSSFYISNEITNKEYREFYNDIKSNPNEKLYSVDLKKEKIDCDTDNKGKINIIEHKYSDIFPMLFKKIREDTIFNSNDYFFNEKFDDFPVVGVPLDAAKFYCIWRTNKEREIIKKENKQDIYDYRIPTESEWEYAASFESFIDENLSFALHEVKIGDSNNLGIYNLEGNVIEWVANSIEKDGKKFNIVRGGSCFTTTDASLRELIDLDKTPDYIGFRIVRSIPEIN